MKPICIDLFSGLGGWTEGFLSEGYECIGFDNERHVYGDQRYPAQLVLQDVLTLHGSQFKDAACIVASPPCQKYSYMAMPWSRAKAMASDWHRMSQDGRDIGLNALFNACFRIQLEAIEAAGHHIPMVVENVKGAQPWVGRAKWHYGSFYLWGDVPALMPFASSRKPDGLPPLNGHDDPRRGRNTNGSWFAVGANGKSNLIEEGRKVPGMNFHEYEKTGKPGRSFQSAAVSMTKDDGRLVDGMKGLDGRSWIRDKSKDPRPNHGNGPTRKAASAQIAKIPFPLSSWIAQCFKPVAQ